MTPDPSPSGGDQLPAGVRHHLTHPEPLGHGVSADVRGEWAPEPPRDALRCDPALVERLTAIARPVPGTARVWIEGVPVVHHPSGAPVACAFGRDWLVVRSAMAPGALTVAGTDGAHSHDAGLGSDWVRLDPWATDTAFARTLQLLRTHVQRAMQLAGDRAG